VTYYFDQEPQPPFDPVQPFPEPEEPPAEERRPWRLTFLAPWEEPEVDRIEELAAARDERWTGRTIIMVALALAVFNAASITSWASTLPPNWGTETIRLVARVWNDRLAQLGLDQPRTTVRKAYEAQKAKRW
jgi:hypothetical protein